MFRIRRRFALICCGATSVFFLTLYYFINNAVSVEERKPDLGDIELKLQQLEKSLLRHGEEMHQLKTRLDGGFHQRILKKPANSPAQNEKRNNENVPLEECTIDLQQVPFTNVQMLDLYSKMSFDDNDGGVWKQGWNIKYDPLKYNDHHKLTVFVVPHSHNDPGWIKTFDEYYEHDTKHILSNALRHLHENPEMKFIWAEISYFARFYEDLGPDSKQQMKRLIQNRQLEFVTGGWVMTDEANSHWFSVLLQLTEGQTWLKKHFNVTPTSSWAIDPFGHSATMPYILKKSGFENLLIQRTHYSVKKELAQNRQLEFLWRQLWDDTGATELFTHMMPFYSYDIPHTCGPDPKICCQFDFKRMPSYGLSCPWRVPPRVIDEQNVASRAEMLVDQWKKKAELYRSKALLIPLGDDFRYSQSTEWEVQRINYQALFDHINGERKYFVDAKFGTLQEYFDAVRNEKRQDIPSLSGDFFTYADRADNYWSGYFTSRPYHKRMDRVLLHYVRAAEMLSAWSGLSSAGNFDAMLQNARRDLSLFQHHDGITGTAKTHVVKDYAKRMLDAVKSCQFVMQQAVYKLLTKPTIYNADYKFNYFHLDDTRWPGPEAYRFTIILDTELPNTHVVLHNSLPQWREEVVEFYVSSPFMSVTSFNHHPVQAQIAPVWMWHRHKSMNTVSPQASSTKYRLLFKVRVPPLGMMTYIIKLEPPETRPAHTSFATNLILTTNPNSLNLGEYPHDVKFGENRELSLRVGKGPTVAFGADGMMKSIQLTEDSLHIPIHLKFLKYGTRKSSDRSGAYLFLPNGPATPFVDPQPPVVLIVEGPLESSVSTALPFAVHQTILRGDAPEIRNIVDIDKMDDTEIVMRFMTHIRSGNTFYTDLNGLQMMKRQKFNKLPLQGNYYPVPSTIYIEDNTTRLTVVTAQPLGGSSLAEGEIEIMQDRRLTHDDERGLGQGVMDNEPVLHIFRIILEKIDTCVRPADLHPAGALTTSAYHASKAILNPLDQFIFGENEWLGVQESFGAQHSAAEDDVEIVAMRSMPPTPVHAPHAHDRDPEVLLNTGVIVHRTNLMECAEPKRPTGVFKWKDLLQFDQKVLAAHTTTLTFLQTLQTLESNEMHLCPMDTKAFVLRHRS